MRILHVISSPASGGAEVYVKDLVLELKQLGHDVAIGFVSRASDIGRGQEYEDLFLSGLDTASIPYFFIGHETKKKIWLGAWRVRNYVKNNNIEIYHAHLPYSVVFSAFLRIPCIYTHHNIVPMMNRFQYFVFNRIIDEYVGISNKCSESLTSYTGRPVKTIQNGINLVKIKKRKPSIKDQKIVKAIAVGRIQPQKNYKHMIDAISRLPAEVLNIFRLDIAGEGPDKEQLLDYIKLKGLEDVVSLLGNRSDIPELLSEADIFLMSSAWEGLPISLIEAAATGLPCLVTDVGGCSEIIEICKNGFFVELDNADEYVEKLIDLILNKSLREEFSFNALNNRSVFSIKNSATKHISIYSDFLQN